jgi:Holliday junction resolvase RusA-like endonuclease
MEINLTFPGEPRAIQSVKGGYKGFYQPKRNVKWKADIRVLAIEQIRKISDFKMLDGYIELTRAFFVFEPPKGLKKIEKMEIENGNYILKNTKPDLTDNLFKGVIDALSEIVFTNDSRICSYAYGGIFKKVYGENPRIELGFRELSLNDNIVYRWSVNV